MKNIINKIESLIFLFVLIGGNPFPVNGQLPEDKLIISKLTGDFYIYTTFKTFNGTLFPSNSMYIVTDDGVILIDTPWDTAQFQPLLDSIHNRHNKDVVLCISTHFHDDRTAGLDFLKQKKVKTFTSKLTYDLCGENNNSRAEFYFENDTAFNAGQYIVQTIYPGEGHTMDNIVIWFPEKKILFGGCLVKSTENSELGNIADANLKKWPLSIKKLIELFPDAEYVIPGHFGWESNKGLEHTLKLLEYNNN